MITIGDLRKKFIKQVSKSLKTYEKFNKTEDEVLFEKYEQECQEAEKIYKEIKKLEDLQRKKK